MSAAVFAAWAMRGHWRRPSTSERVGQSRTPSAYEATADVANLRAQPNEGFTERKLRWESAQYA